MGPDGQRRSRLAQDNKSTVSKFSEWHILQGVWSTTRGEAEKRDKRVPRLPISASRFREPTERATVRGKTGNPGFPHGGMVVLPHGAVVELTPGPIPPPAGGGGGHRHGRASVVAVAQGPTLQQPPFTSVGHSPTDQEAVPRGHGLGGGGGGGRGVRRAWGPRRGQGGRGAQGQAFAS